MFNTVSLLTVVPFTPIQIGICLVTSVAVAILIKCYRWSKQSASAKIYSKVQKLDVSKPNFEHKVLKICQMVSLKKIYFEASRENHALHDRLTEITLKVATPQVKTIWENFLNQLHHKQALYHDGTQILLDLSPELNYLTRKTFKQIKIEKIELKTNHLRSILDQIYEIEVESFGKSEAEKKEYLLDYLEWGQPLIAAIDDKNQVLGHLLASNQEPHTYVRSFGRRANASKIGVGKQLMDYFINQVANKNLPILLDVREGNTAAIKLYQSFQFVEVSRNAFSYRNPSETAIRMLRTVI